MRTSWSVALTARFSRRLSWSCRSKLLLQLLHRRGHGSKCLIKALPITACYHTNTPEPSMVIDLRALLPVYYFLEETSDSNGIESCLLFVVVACALFILTLRENSN